MTSEFQRYQSDRAYEGRRRARRRILLYIALIVACFAFWAGVLYGALHGA